MPRVHSAVKSKAGKPYTCTKCGERIEPGTRYYSWSFRYGGTRRQHEACGYPKPSQLTQSKLGNVYAAQEDAEEAITNASDASEIAQALNEVAQAARDTAEEYRDAVQAMNMEGAGTENEERADALESYADELENEASDIESGEWVADVAEEQVAPDDADADDLVDADGNTEEEWLDALRDRARDAMGNLEL